MTRNNLRSRILLALTIAAMTTGISTAAFAATDTDPVAVSASITSSCILSAGTMAFGAYSPLSGAASDVSGSITVTCTDGTAWALTADIGLGAGATFASRKMTHTNTTSLLNYSLYTEGTHTTAWDATTGTITGTGNGAAQATTFYGRIFGSQETALPGSYSDTVTVTVTY